MSDEYIKKVNIAVDAMGGDKDPSAIVSGAAAVSHKFKDILFTFFGDETKISHELFKNPQLKDISKIHHTQEIVSSNDTPSYALRNAKRSSMRLAIDAVKSKECDAVVSAGNTGALMAISKIVLRMIQGIERPAICSVIPTYKSSAVMLDMGANIECTATNLVQFAVMGNAFAKIILGLDSPKVGILNVGSEDIKGRDAVKLAAQHIRDFHHDINFYGFVEGDSMMAGVSDVIVTDGFSGNIAIKTAEGTAKLCREFMKSAFASSWISKIGYLLAKSGIKKAFSKLDHRNYNGAMLVGLDGIVVKSHGSSDEVGMAHAIEVAYNLAKAGITEILAENIESSMNNDAMMEE